MPRDRKTPSPLDCGPLKLFAVDAYSECGPVALERPPVPRRQENDPFTPGYNFPSGATIS
jgi:hypothetical protein